MAAHRDWKKIPKQKAARGTLGRPAAKRRELLRLAKIQRPKAKDRATWQR